MTLPTAALEFAADCRANVVYGTVVGQAWSPQVNARAIAARGDGLFTEVTRQDLLGQLGPPGALEAYEILRCNRDHACVAATAGRTGQAIELFRADFGQAWRL